MIFKCLMLSLVVGLNCGSQVTIVGVAPSKLLLYQPNKDFTCFDGSLSIPFQSVNDDFCDCSDGSDEPGTSACTGSIFFCPNNGYYPLNVPSSRVNDGICDCCDGSDEYLSANCTDTCDALGALALAEAERAAELLNRGNSMRLQMSASGKQIRQQKHERSMELAKELAEAEKVKKDAEELKNNAEARENSALEVYREQEERVRVAAAEREKQARELEARQLFSDTDSNGDGALVPEEILALLKNLKSSEGKTDALLEEEVKFIMNSKTEFKFEEFFESTFNRLKSLMAAENVGTSWEGEGEAVEKSEEGEAGGEEVDEGENEEENEDARGGEEGEEEGEGGEEARGEEGEAEQYGPVAPPSSSTEYDEDTKRIVDEANSARQHFEETDRNYKDIERDISALKEFLEKDFGPEDEFLSLEGQCFSYSDREYTYKLCPFDQVVQSGKHGGSETRLGSWKGWETPGNYNTMVYDRGQSCWNGPQRSVRVNLICGLENEVFNAAEPNKCEYLLDFRTPAACRPPPRHTKDNVIRDEL